MKSRPVSSKVHSVNVSGALQSVLFAGQRVTTGFFKTAVQEKVYAHRLGLEGDAQADLTVHGGPEKAVYFYPREHYARWEALLGTGPLPPGSFGENITSEGLLESAVYIGDILEIGTAILQVRQPRSPCYKLQIRFRRPDMTALFFEQGKPGWYASVLQAGTFAARDKIRQSRHSSKSVTVADVWQCGMHRNADLAMKERIADLELLPAFWKHRVGRPSST